ncbi:uncharacterized protein BDV17DRAFT_254228 [Aspergillus undulatus]|uniref:uncharacterized protein n=1 Tax=Aspergillus undulatus TaxID=1810928 RepID=UPI003CCD904D
MSWLLFDLFVDDDSPLIHDGVWELDYRCSGFGSVIEAIIDLDLLILSCLILPCFILVSRYLLHSYI